MNATLDYPTSPNRTRRFPVVACLLLAAVLVGFTLPALNQHSLERHGSEAVAVYEAMCAQGPEATFTRDNRTILCTKLDNGRYGVVVEENECDTGLCKLVTAFKTKYKFLADLANYLARTGARLIEPPPAVPMQ